MVDLEELNDYLWPEYCVKCGEGLLPRRIVLGYGAIHGERYTGLERYCPTLLEGHDVRVFTNLKTSLLLTPVRYREWRRDYG
jgi:hypothetical protein